MSWGSVSLLSRRQARKGRHPLDEGCMGLKPRKREGRPRGPAGQVLRERLTHEVNHESWVSSMCRTQWYQPVWNGTGCRSV